MSQRWLERLGCAKVQRSDGEDSRRDGNEGECAWSRLCALVLVKGANLSQGAKKGCLMHAQMMERFTGLGLPETESTHAEARAHEGVVKIEL